MSFLSLNDDIKPWLGIEVSDTSQDAVLSLINEATEASVINYVETDFKLHEEVGEVLDGNISDMITPKNTPIVSVQKVILYRDVGGGTEISPDYYQVIPGAILLNYYNTYGMRSAVEIDYTWGYDGLPSDVKLAMIQMIESEYRRKNMKSLGIGGKTKKDESISFKNEVESWDEGSGLLKVLASKLEPYRQTFEFPVQPMHTRSY